MKSQLFPHQDRGIQQLREAFATPLDDGRKLKAAVHQGPTGSGKTVTAAAITESCLSNDRTVTFMVPALELVDQTIERFNREGLADIGVIQGITPEDRRMPLQIASVQTLQNRELPDTHWFIIDECHIWFQLYERLWQERRGRIIGLSATPWTKGLGSYYGALVCPATMRELQAAINPQTGEPFLVSENVLAPTSVDLSGVSMVAGDYHQGQLSKIMRGKTLVGDVVESWRALAQGRSTFTFCVDRAHAMAVFEAFERARVRAAYLDGFTKRETRRYIREQFAAGEIQVVVSVGALTTGIDWDVRCIQLARPTKSEMLFVQMIGRGMRPAEAKEDLLVIDHTDTYLNLGFAADIHHEVLNDGSTPVGRAAVERKPSVCPTCHRVKPIGELTCKTCGFTPAPQNRVKQVAGTLGRLDTGRQAEREARVEFYAQLKGYAQQKAYKPGWVAHTFREKFKEWPPRSWDFSVAAEPPGAEVRGFITFLAIRKAKAKKAHPDMMAALNEPTR